MKKIAVGVGHEFNIFNESQVSHINLAKGNTKVFVNGVSYELHFARTFEDSTKVDSLLDSVGGLKLMIIRGVKILHLIPHLISMTQKVLALDLKCKYYLHGRTSM